MKDSKLIGEIHGIKIFSNKKVPEGQIWVEESHRPNPTFKGGLLDTLAFTQKIAFVKRKQDYTKIRKIVLRG